MKKTLLINPPFYRLMGSHFNSLNLGLCYLTAVLKNNGQEVMIYNADFIEGDCYLSQRQLFNNYQMYKEILSDLSHPIWQEIKKRISEYKPEILGISMHTGTFKSSKLVAQIAKEISKEIITVVGGAHPTLDPSGTIGDKNIDLVIRGEGELTFLELVWGMDKQNILGLSYKDNVGEIVHNPSRPFVENLNSLPFPEREAIFDVANHDVGAIITGRGCPFSCIYCASPKIWQCQVRLRSIDNVLTELRYLAENHNSSIIYFVDDTFTLNRQRTKEICQRIIEEGLKIKWKCDTRVDCLDAELVSLMRQAGCIRVKLGVESGSERILRKIEKRITKDQIRQSIRLLKKESIPITVYLMVGFPGETQEDLVQTISFAEEINVDYYSLSIFSPYYGTKVYEQLMKEGTRFRQEHWEYFFHQSKQMVEGSNINKEILEQFLSLNEKVGRGVRV